jgi:Domain of unknown function (DUF4150)/GHH signature containing HNH/Endo VII superfamily nuclease toxin  2
MSNEVYANGLEVSCKAGSGKSTAAFPDVCFTPPQTPATPPGVPLPYPNTGVTSDTTDGSKTVQISGQEVMLKNKSYFKKSSGDEAGSAPKKGAVTSVNTGKVYFNAWSMDVKFEGENVVRHTDLTTHNHASFPGNSPTWPFLDATAFGGDGPCKEVADQVKKKCAKHAKPHLEKKGKSSVFPTSKPGDSTHQIGLMNAKRDAAMGAMCKDPDCKKALKCVLSKKDPSTCCPVPQPSPPKQTPHHIVPDSQFHTSGAAEKPTLPKGKSYDYDAAPCVCAAGVTHSGKTQHARIHTRTNNLTVNHASVLPDVNPSGKSIDDSARWKVSEAEDVGAEAVAKETKCDKACIKSQVRAGHKKMGINSNDSIRPTTAGSITKPPDMTALGYP